MRLKLEMLKQFVNHNEANDLVVHHVDTARIYAGGKTEEPIVGNVLRSCTPWQGTIILDTKARPSVEGGLSAKGIKSQLKESLHAMGVTSFGEYYLHQPDTEHSLLESLTCAHELVKDGIVGTIGMSNYHPDQKTGYPFSSVVTKRTSIAIFPHLCVHSLLLTASTRYWSCSPSISLLVVSI